ncbi:MAG: hypothetical protein RML35_04070 [Chloroherpetonaceae bacterium]|nr:hypothetical protein [Chloroherpetonaceae bacterium]
MPKGGKWSAPMELVSTGVLSDCGADIAVGKDGKVHIVWVNAERVPKGI